MLPYDLFMDWPSDCPPLTEEMREEAERQLGFVLPQSLIDILKIQNGGLLRQNRLYAGTDPELWPDAGDEGYLCLYGLFGLCSEHGINRMVHGRTLNESLKEQWGYPPNSVVLIQQGHAGFALHYKGDAEPEVTRVYSECYPEIRIATVAPTFADLLAKLEFTGFPLWVYPITKIHFTGYGCLQKIPFTKLLRVHLGLGLRDAKKIVDAVLENETVTIRMESAEGAVALLDQAKLLGVEGEVTTET